MRIGFALAALIGGIGVLAYLACWLIIPAESESESESASADGAGAPVVRGIVVLAQLCAACVGLATLPAVGAAGAIFGFGWIVLAVAAAILVGVLATWPRVGAGWALLPVAALILPALAMNVGGIRVAAQTAAAGHFEIVGEAGGPAEAIAVIGETHPDVVLLDVHLPDGGGVAVLDALGISASSSKDPPRVLALSVSDAAEDVVPMIRAGALGYVTKTIDTAALVEAVERVAGGDAYFSPRLAAFVLQAFSSPGEPAATAAAEDPLRTLTPREREVLHHLARGYAYKRIALRLGISSRTVESHVGAVLRKLQLTSRHEISHWVASRGLIEDDDALRDS